MPEPGMDAWRCKNCRFYMTTSAAEAMNRGEWTSEPAPAVAQYRQEYPTTVTEALMASERLWGKSVAEVATQAQRLYNDQLTYGVAYMKNGQRVDPRNITFDEIEYIDFGATITSVDPSDDVIEVTTADGTVRTLALSGSGKLLVGQRVDIGRGINLSPPATMTGLRAFISSNVPRGVGQALTRETLDEYYAKINLHWGGFPRSPAAILSNITEDINMENTILEYVTAIQDAQAAGFLSADEAKSEARKLFSTSREVDDKVKKIADAEAKLAELKGETK